MKLKSRKTRRGIQPESVMFDSRTRVDADNGIVHNAKILGLKSRHGYTYSPRAAKEAIPLYEGAAVNIDHPNRATPGASRSYRDRFGYFKNVKFVEGDGLRGEFRFNPKHAIAPQFIWDAQNNPKACGFSHNAKGPLTQRGNGELVCESIEAVRSVDLVADAATTASLFEGKPRMKVRKNKGNKSRRRLTPEGKNRIRRQMVQRFGRELARELMEAVGPEGAAAMMTAPDASGGGAGGAGAVDALMSLIRSVIENPNISAEESIKQVSKRLKALKDMIPGGAAAKPADDPAAALAEGDDDDDDADDDDRVESDDDDEPAPRRKTAKAGSREERLAELVERMEAREEKEAINDLCESLGFKPTKAQLGLLVKVADDEDREALIESWQEANPAAFRFKPAGGNKPKSRELQEGKATYKSAKEWAAGLKR